MHILDKRQIIERKGIWPILKNNKQKHLDMRQEGGIFTGITSLASSTAVSMVSNSLELGRLNWVQLKGWNASTYIITAYQYVKLKSVVGTVFMQRERYFKRCDIFRCPRQ